MALNLEQKKAVVAEVNEVAASAFSAIAAEYHGLSVSSLTDLRKKARESGVYLRVVKNTLAKRALVGTEFECMNQGLVGPMLLAFSQDDPGAAARLLGDFKKANDKLQVKIVSIGGVVYPASDLKRLADLPTKDQAIAILMGLMKAPIEKFVRTLAEPHAKLVRTVAAIRDKKQAA